MDRHKKEKNAKVNKIFNIDYNNRIVVLFFMLAIVLALIIIKLIYLQLTPGGNKYRKLSAKQVTNTLTIEADRGKIFDRNGEVLADNIVSNNLYVDSKNLTEDTKKSIIDFLSKNIAMKPNYIREQLNMGKSTILKPSLTKPEIDKIKNAPTSVRRYLSIIPENKRYYPNKEMLAPVLGFTNLNNDGVVGLESYYNSKLKGKPGKRILNSSVNNSETSVSNPTIIEPQKGLSLKTTLDSTIQGFVEDSLKDIENNFKPKSATIIVTNPNNGEVLAMGSYPSFNPNSPNDPLVKSQIDELNTIKKEDPSKIQDFHYKMWENKAVSWTYEPGSVFKTITSAAATEEHTSTKDSHYFCNGFVRDIPGVVIRCESWADPHGDETFQEAFNNSCNVAYVHIGRDLGKANMQKYINGFGFNQKTNIDLPAEELGLAPKNVKEIDAARFATLSYGHGISATPIRMITALNAIVNGGIIVEPHIASEFLSQENKLVDKIEPKSQKQIISSTSSEKMNKMLQGVVDDGSGKRSKIEGFAIGGKTGTSIKIENGKYTDDKTTASFFASFPTDHPEYTILIVVDEPQRKSGGSAVCAPSAGKILSNIIKYKNIQKTRPSVDVKKEVSVPELKGLSLKDAVSKLSQIGLKSNVINSNFDINSIVKSQEIEPYSEVEKGTIVELTTDQKGRTMIKMPEIVGFDVEDAIDVLKEYGIEKIETNSKKGKVFKTIPEENSMLDPDSYVKIYVERGKNENDSE